MSEEDFIKSCQEVVDLEHGLIAESAERQGLTPLEAEIKFREYWGL